MWRWAGSSGSWCGSAVGPIFRNVQQQVAAHRHVQQLHAGADAEHGRAALGDHPHQPAIEQLAARGQRANRGVQHPAVAARIEVGAPHEHHAVDAIEHLLQVFVAFERRNDERNAADLADRVVVARRDVRETGLFARGVREIGIETNDWLRHSCTPLLGVVTDASYVSLFHDSLAGRTADCIGKLAASPYGPNADEGSTCRVLAKIGRWPCACAGVTAGSRNSISLRPEELPSCVAVSCGRWECKLGVTLRRWLSDLQVTRPFWVHARTASTTSCDQLTADCTSRVSRRSVHQLATANVCSQELVANPKKMPASISNG